MTRSQSASSSSWVVPRICESAASRLAADAGEPALQDLIGDLAHRGIIPRLRADLGYPAPHQPAPEHADPPDLRHRLYAVQVAATACPASAGPAAPRAPESRAAPPGASARARRSGPA